MPDNALDRSDFAGAGLWEPDQAYSLILESLDADPLLGAFTTIRTGRASVAFPNADFSGAEWVAELGTIPAMDMDDSAPVVAPAKLAGRFMISSESVDDADFPVAQFTRAAINRTVVRKAAHDVLYGEVSPGPAGVFTDLEVIDASTLRAGVTSAVAAIARNYGQATTVVVSPERWQEEIDRRESLSVPSASADGLFADLGLVTRISPALEETDALVLDSRTCYKIIRRDVKIEMSAVAAEAWNSDGVAVRVIARLAAAIPRPLESARSITVTPAP